MAAKTVELLILKNNTFMSSCANKCIKDRILCHQSINHNPLFRSKYSTQVEGKWRRRKRRRETERHRDPRRRRARAPRPAPAPATSTRRRSRRTSRPSPNLGTRNATAIIVSDRSSQNDDFREIIKNEEPRLRDRVN